MNKTNSIPTMNVTEEAHKPMKASYIIERYCFEEDKYELQNSYDSLPEALAAYPKIFEEVESKPMDDIEKSLKLDGLYRIRCEMDVVVATNH